MESLSSQRRKKNMNWPKYSVLTNPFRVNNSCSVNGLVIGQKVSIAGRIVFFRDLGKIVFGKIRDFYDICQFSLSADQFENIKEIKNLLDIGDIIGIEGEIYETQKGEKTVNVTNLVFMRKAFLPLPDKWEGLQNEELKVRYRYVDIITDENTRNKFLYRFKIINAIKKYLMDRGFLEVETPILQPIASGAAANPFKTKHDALKIDMYLRIAPELYLKRLLIAGIPKVFEMGKCFRNEGIDPTHLQEFTMLEFYEAYCDYETLQQRAIDLLQIAAACINPSMIIGEMDFNNIEKISYVDFLKKYGNLDFDRFEDIEYLRNIARENHIDLSKCKSHYAIVDAIYKNCCVKKILSPLLVFNYPRHPLAKIDDFDDRFANKFQVILNKQEVVNAFLELNDPDIQKTNFEEQKKMNEGGENDVVRTDDDFVEALEHGMPPAGGFGLGIDRIVTILTQSSSIKDIVLFPQIKGKQ